MTTFEHTVEIAAPIEHAWEFGMDPENWTRTMPSLTEVEIVEETDDGFRMNATYRLLGTSLDGEMEFTVVEPAAHSVTTFESPGMAGEVHYRYSETDGGTEVVQSCEYELGESLRERLFAPVARRYNRRQFKHSLETTKELVEAEADTMMEVPQ